MNLHGNAGESTALRTDPWYTHSVKIVDVLEETPGVATYTISFRDPEVAKRYQFLPGQFNMLYVPGVGESAISISGPMDETGVLQHTIRSVGGVTEAIARHGKGMSLGLRGPFGTSWPVDRWSKLEIGKRDVIIVAGGIGLAPLRSTVYALIRDRDSFGRCAVLVGARTPRDLLYQREYESWRRHGIHVETTVDRATDAWSGHVGVVTELLHRHTLPRPEEAILMTCGPEVMMRYVTDAAQKLHFSDENIWVSLERNMNCAVGLCGHCQLGSQFLCKDGPVFAYPKVAALLRVRGL